MPRTIDARCCPSSDTNTQRILLGHSTTCFTLLPVVACLNSQCPSACLPAHSSHSTKQCHLHITSLTRCRARHLSIYAAERDVIYMLFEPCLFEPMRRDEQHASVCFHHAIRKKLMPHEGLTSVICLFSMPPSISRATCAKNAIADSALCRHAIIATLASCFVTPREEAEFTRALVYHHSLVLFARFTSSPVLVRILWYRCRLMLNIAPRRRPSRATIR